MEFLVLPTNKSENFPEVVNLEGYAVLCYIGRKWGVMSPGSGPDVGEHMSSNVDLLLEVGLLSSQPIALFSKRRELILLLGTPLLQPCVNLFGL